MWDNKELSTLQEDLRLLYKKARQRIKTMKRDVRKLDAELQRKRELAAKRPKPNEIANAYTEPNGTDSKNKDGKQRVCGVMNSRGNPCQRTGFCPFHHKLTNSRDVPRYVSC
jgi:Sec-independent protein translocase protein TatA